MSIRIDISCGLSWLALANHRECSSSSANSTTACGHACGWMMASARICSTWSRALGKGVWSRHSVEHIFTAVVRVAERRFTADAVIMGSMVQLQRKKEKGEKKRGRARAGRLDG